MGALVALLSESKTIVPPDLHDRFRSRQTSSLDKLGPFSTSKVKVRLTGLEEVIHPPEYLRKLRFALSTSPVLQGKETSRA